MPSQPSDGAGVVRGLLLGLQRPEFLTMSQWAEKEFVLSAEGSAEPGRYYVSRAEYQRGMLDAVSDPGVKEVVFKTSAQVGKTTVLLIAIGYTAHHAPAPMLLIEPTLEMTEAFSKERLEPAIRDVPAMARVFPPEKSRSSGNTLRHKKFPGGFIALAGANSPTSLRMRAIKIVLADEVDAYPVSAGTEGDPVELARQRTQTFYDAKLVAASTPTHKGASKIDRMFEESDQRYFLVPCPECSTFQRLVWEQVRWTKGKPETAYYECPHCGCPMEDHEIKRAVRYGHWKAHAPFNGRAGFHISALYSPWRQLPELVAMYERAVGFTDRMQAFVNNVLGEVWEGEVSGTVEAKVLYERREPMPPGIVPERAGLLTAGVDVQIDRIEAQVSAWGMENERWLLEHVQLYGDPNGEPVWRQLEEYLRQTWKHAGAGGHELPIEVVAIDTGGYHTQKVYDFCARHILAGRLWWPIKGISGWGKPIWKRSNVVLRGGVRLFLVGVDDAKSSVYASLAVQTPGPGYVHIPDTWDIERLERLTVEKVRTTTDKRGFIKREWYKPEGARNEEFDCAVYALAARMSVQVDMGARLEYLNKPKAPVIDGAAIARMFAR